MCDWYEKGRGKGKARQYCGSVGVRGRVIHRKCTCTCLSDGRGMTTRCSDVLTQGQTRDSGIVLMEGGCPGLSGLTPNAAAPPRLLTLPHKTAERHPQAGRSFKLSVSAGHVWFSGS